MTLDLYQCNWEQKLAQSQEQSLLFSGPEQAVQDAIAWPNPQGEWTQFPTLVWFRHGFFALFSNAMIKDLMLE